MAHRMPKRAKGPEAANLTMTKDQKKERALKASQSRWKKQKGNDWEAPLPIAEFKGTGFLAGDEVECYVLSNGERVISYSQCIKLIAGKETGKIESYLNMLPKAGGKLVDSSPKSLISSTNVAGQSIDFIIAETKTSAKGLRAETFADICSAFVEAAYRGLLTTERQKEIAWKCAILQSGFMKLGIVGYVDEITGFQNYRSKDELEVKLNAYIADHIKEWRKTFPDEYYQELARLCNVPDWKKKQPHYAQITDKIYDMVDPEVARKLADLDINPRVHKHQYLTENFGLEELHKRINQVIGLARGCATIREFNEKMKLFEPGGTYQMAFPFDRRKSMW